MTVQQPCWSCAKACGGCAWSAKFEPVPGWDAKESTIKYNDGTPKTPKIRNVRSYIIKSCPEYEPDGKASAVKDIPSDVMLEALKAIRRICE